jgi:hypothetical protein
VKHHTKDRSEVKDSQELLLRGENGISVNQTGKEEGKEVGTSNAGRLDTDEVTGPFIHARRTRVHGNSHYEK